MWHFGRDPDLRCPHYLDEAGGLCGIWRHRNGVCATWFCKHDRGAAGQRFWNAAEALLALVERELSHWCACQLLYHGAPPGSAEHGDDELPEWSAWAPHAREYYLRAAAMVDELSWSEVQMIAGHELTPLAARLQAAFAELQPPAPGPRTQPLVQLRGRAVQLSEALRVSHRGAARTRVVSYSDSDPLDLPSELVAVLPRFDGRPTEVVRAELAAEGVLLTDELLAQLVDFAVLERPDAP